MSDCATDFAGANTVTRAERATTSQTHARRGRSRLRELLALSTEKRRHCMAILRSWALGCRTSSVEFTPARVCSSVGRFGKIMNRADILLSLRALAKQFRLSDREAEEAARLEPRGALQRRCRVVDYEVHMVKRHLEWTGGKVSSHEELEDADARFWQDAGPSVRVVASLLLAIEGYALGADDGSPARLDRTVYGVRRHGRAISARRRTRSSRSRTAPVDQGRGPLARS